MFLLLLIASYVLSVVISILMFHKYGHVFLSEDLGFAFCFLPVYNTMTALASLFAHLAIFICSKSEVLGEKLVIWAFKN